MHTDLLVLLGRLPPGKVEALEERPHHLLEQPRARHPAVDVVLRDPRRDLQAVRGGQAFALGLCMLVPHRAVSSSIPLKCWSTVKGMAGSCCGSSGGGRSGKGMLLMAWQDVVLVLCWPSGFMAKIFPK
jgi:hypothetical protein